MNSLYEARLTVYRMLMDSRGIRIASKFGEKFDHVFNIWFVTARGNLISFGEARYITISDLTEAIGPVLLDHRSLRWYSKAIGNNGTWQVSRSETSLKWFLNLTNWAHGDIELSYDSIFMISSAGQSMVWYIH